MSAVQKREKSCSEGLRNHSLLFFSPFFNWIYIANFPGRVAALDITPALLADSPANWILRLSW